MEGIALLNYIYLKIIIYYYHFSLNLTLLGVLLDFALPTEGSLFNDPTLIFGVPLESIRLEGYDFLDVGVFSFLTSSFEVGLAFFLISPADIYLGDFLLLLTGRESSSAKVGL
jgi:hypothetical protein